MHHCLLCLGSNLDYKTHLRMARLALEKAFPGIRFGMEMETEAIGGRWLSPFGNQLAEFESSFSVEEICHILKRIEKDNGRIAEDKENGIVKIDIDLLMFDDMVLKPDDLKRPFIVSALEQWTHR